MNYAATLTVEGLRALLADPRLRADDRLAKILTTWNLAVIREDVQIGYVDLVSGENLAPSVELFEGVFP